MCFILSLVPWCEDGNNHPLRKFRITLKLRMWSIERVHSSDRKRMCLCVEDPLVRADDMLVTEEQVKVLEGLRQEERLLHIILVSANLVDITDPSVSSVCSARILQSLYCLPSPFPILGVLCQSPHNEIRLK